MAQSVPFDRFAPPIRKPTLLRQAITAACRRPESECLRSLLDEAAFPSHVRAQIDGTARQLVEAIRAAPHRGGMEGLMQEYELSSEEGVALMCLAEALLRIPDKPTRMALVRDKVGHGDWQSHMGDGRSVFVNAATWGLVVTGRLVATVDDGSLSQALARLITRAGAPIVLKAVDIAIRLLGEQFVAGKTIDEALRRAGRMEAKGFTYSYDMLGEAAMTAGDAERYFGDYVRAIGAIGAASGGRGVIAGPGISIKLSALHPRYSRAQAERVMSELLPRVKVLASLAKSHDIALNIDAEEADRLELSLDILESLALDPELSGWGGLGFVLQAYGKRCPFVIDWIVDLACRSDRRLMVRLVKGAYWDAEIKRAQVEGLADFPVYTRKAHTDVAYIACVKRLLAARDAVLPQFATHNAQTLAAIYHMAGPGFAQGDYEFQCLHGMGEPLYEHVVGNDNLGRPCRIYAPVGEHEALLAYLVRRLLENGANSSFVNRIADQGVSVDALIADPVELVLAEAEPGRGHQRIAKPRAILGERRNSAGIDLSDENALALLGEKMRESASLDWRAAPANGEGTERAIHNPADHRDRVGSVIELAPFAAAALVRRAALSEWKCVPVELRAAMLERAADELQTSMPVLMGLLVREAGKSAANAIAEVREAIDFLRYYAEQARIVAGASAVPLGPVVCISPWNFPLAIFTGQLSAALVAGNPVLAKPAERTPLIAAEVVRILHEAGIPEDALQFVPGDGAVGAALVGEPEVAAVMFTGSMEVARLIQGQLAGRLSARGKPIPLIAETGGINAMIVDSSALAEQVVSDVILSAFDSAGQRCSALRILCLQEDIAERTLAMLKGALHEMRVGPTDRLANDIGPVITREARSAIEAHIEQMADQGCPVERIMLGTDCSAGTFVAPTIVEIDDLDTLEREIFGPVLHVMRFRRQDLDSLIDRINGKGYGLTFGLHTRLDETIAHVTSRIRAGNLYINRNIIGAVVGVQPFGGRGLSGTGPKAGGPLYLRRLVSGAAPIARAGRLADPGLLRWIEWLDDNGEDQAAEGAKLCAARSALGLEMEFAGPVGERNFYRLEPRGTVLAWPETQEGLYRQIAAALASGCNVAVKGMDIPNGLPPELTTRVRMADQGAIAAALLEGAGDVLTAKLQTIAEIPGPVVPAHVPTRDDYCLDWLLDEVSLSINTTAAGGNASLMTID